MCEEEGLWWKYICNNLCLGDVLGCIHIQATVSPSSLPPPHPPDQGGHRAVQEPGSGDGGEEKDNPQRTGGEGGEGREKGGGRGEERESAKFMNRLMSL